MSREKKKNRRLRFIISSVLSFLLAVLLTVGTLIIGVFVGFINENRVLDGLNYRDYYSSVEETFYQNAADLTTPIGLPESLVENIVDSKLVYEDVRGYVRASIQGETYKFHTDELEQNLTGNVNRYFESEGLVMNEEQQNTVPEYAKMISEQYEEDLKLPFIKYFHSMERNFKKVMMVVLPGVAFLAIFIITMLWRMYRWKHRAIRFMIYATFASAGMVAIPSVLALISGFYKKINISTEYVYYAFVRYINNGFMVFLYLAAGWLVISLGLLMLIKYLKNNS